MEDYGLIAAGGESSVCDPVIEMAVGNPVVGERDRVAGRVRDLDHFGMAGAGDHFGDEQVVGGRLALIGAAVEWILVAIVAFFDVGA